MKYNFSKYIVLPLSLLALIMILFPYCCLTTISLSMSKVYNEWIDWRLPINVADVFHKLKYCLSDEKTKQRKNKQTVFVDEFEIKLNQSMNYLFTSSLLFGKMLKCRNSLKCIQFYWSKQYSTSFGAMHFRFPRCNFRQINLQM